MLPQLIPEAALTSTVTGFPASPVDRLSPRSRRSVSVGITFHSRPNLGAIGLGYRQRVAIDLNLLDLLLLRQVNYRR